MRKSFLLIGLGIALLGSVSGNAQEISSGLTKQQRRGLEAGFRSTVEKNEPTIDYETENLAPRINQSQQIIHQRAMKRAQHRSSRIEARKRLGYSMQRPHIRRGSHAVETNLFLSYPWSFRSNSFRR